MSHAEVDPYLWLEDVEADKALDWARALNQESYQWLAGEPLFTSLKQRMLETLDSDQRIPYVTQHGAHLYNFWTDQQNPKGLWRRTTLESYRRADTQWEILLNLDALSEEEDENWVWKGVLMCRSNLDRCLLRLSRGGADATVTREFDLSSRLFVDHGFNLPEAKSRVSWVNADTVYVGTDFGPGSLTDSGYPNWVKRWRRGQSLEEAKLLFVGSQQDVATGASVLHHRHQRTDLIVRSDTFWTQEVFISHKSQWVRIDKPPGAEIGVFGDYLILQLREDWEIASTRFKAGSLLATGRQAFLEGERSLELLFEPSETASLDNYTVTKNWIILNILDNVQNRLIAIQPADKGQWAKRPIDLPTQGTASIRAYDADQGDRYWLTATDFLTPNSLYLGNLADNSLEPIKHEPTSFDGNGLTIQQYHATSKDGTSIPYFLVGQAAISPGANTPTLLYGYGGFEIPMLSTYRALTGIGWLEKGGCYVVANIRGGGEFGPRWHQAALKANRQKAYDDFIAVAEDLIDKGITSSRHLGIRGGSNGGLLMGNMLVQRPELFNAIVCQVPLLDMSRYHLLLAGASWMGEYGDPDQPEDWAYLSAYSPYHNLKAEKKYPKTFFTTSTRDDRVHPGHARKMVAKMKDLGHSVLYYENIEGGHGGASDNPQRAHIEAMIHTFLWKMLGN